MSTPEALAVQDGMTMPDDGADACARCGYDLRGMADDQPCPECGLLAERSRQRSDHLHDATPRWLRGISIGVTLILIAHVCAAAWPFLIGPVNMWFFELRYRGATVSRVGPNSTSIYTPYTLAPSPLLDMLQPFVSMAGFDFAAVLLAVGAWLLTRSQGRPASDAADRRWRRTLRIIAFVPLAVLVYLHARLATPALRSSSFGEFELWTIALALALGCAAIAPLMFFQLRRLAQRVLHPRLAEHAAIVGVGFSAALVLIPIVAFIMQQHDEGDWMNRSWVPLALITTMLVSLILFAGWSALNCVRFILAFRKAYRGALGKWSAADRAMPTE